MSDDFTPDDPLPGLLAEVDQAVATSPILARLARSYFEAFVEQGFTERQAIYLTAAQMHRTPGTAT